MDFLVPEATVERLVSTRQLTPEARALAYFQFFDGHSENDIDCELRLTETTRFYNRYYWFALFAAHRQAANGFDAGIEQQKFQMLETAPNGIDWGVVERIDKLTAVE
jgi:hypothetical protein